MNSPVFSIITPTFRRPGLLKRNILSVINQTFENYEHIIVDDANEDETEKLINSFNDERIFLLKHHYQRGAGAAYNTGLKFSKGKYILFLDDDDEYLPCFLKKMYESISVSTPETGAVMTGFLRITDNGTGEEVKSSVVWPVKFPDKEKELIAATSIGNGCGICIKKECFDQIGNFDESIKYGQDTEFLFRLVNKFRVETVPEALVKIHSHHLPQLTDPSNDKERLDSHERFLERNSKMLNLYPELYSTHYMVVANLCYKLKLRKRGRKILLSIIKKNPAKFLNYTDLLSYEIFGMNSVDLYSRSRLWKVIRLIKKI
jgi:glycosyltransferase involved in cell wall biosynthesis